jgi:hypothetical protein
MSETDNASTSYHRMSLAEKQAYALARMREPAIACPHCDTQTTAADLLEHVATRCQGPREPGPSSKWITWREARAIVPRATLARWIKAGKVRVRGELHSRRYLLRDLVVKVARRRM